MISEVGFERGLGVYLAGWSTSNIGQEKYSGLFLHWHDEQKQAISFNNHELAKIWQFQGRTILI